MDVFGAGTRHSEEQKSAWAWGSSRLGSLTSKIAAWGGPIPKGEALGDPSSLSRGNVAGQEPWKVARQRDGRCTATSMENHSRGPSWL